MPGYYFFRQQAVEQNDIRCGPLGSQTPAEIAAQCEATSGCVSFIIFAGWVENWLPSFCLKTSNAAMSDVSNHFMRETCHGTYVRSE